AHRLEERRRPLYPGIVPVELCGGNQGLNSGGFIAAAIFRHAEGQQRPFILRYLHPRATEGQRRLAFRLVVGRKETTHLGRAIGHQPVVGAPGEGEDLPSGGGEVLPLPEPPLESGDLQDDEVVVGIGGQRRYQQRDCIARAAAGQVGVHQDERRGDGGRVVGPKGLHFVVAGFLQQLDQVGLQLHKCFL